MFLKWRTNRGIAYLDEIAPPSWHQKVNLGFVALSDDRCYLTQVFGDWKKGLPQKYRAAIMRGDRGQHKMSDFFTMIQALHWMISHGFALSTCAVLTFRHQGYQEHLHQLWAKEIELRRALDWEARLKELEQQKPWDRFNEERAHWGQRERVS